MPKEGVIVANCLKYLRTIPNSRWFKTHGDPFGRVGLPDIIGCVEGQFYGLEVKQHGEQATERQLYEMHQWADAGAIVAVVRCVADCREVVKP
jgi:hypothetical protein